MFDDIKRNVELALEKELREAIEDDPTLPRQDKTAEAKNIDNIADLLAEAIEDDPTFHKTVDVV